MPTPRWLSAAGWILAALALAWAGIEAVSLWRVLEAHPAPPRWDMAGHGWQGVELLTDLRAGRPLDFLLDLNAQDKWPFGYSLLLLSFLALGGASFEAARLLSLVGWVAVAPLTVLAARKAEPGPAGLLGGALAAVLWLAAPVPRVLSLVILREVVALALQLLALILYLRAREKDEDLGRWRAAGLATLALVLVKYNYALIWGVAVAIEEVLRSTPEQRRRLWRWLRDLLTPWGGKPLARKILAGALDLVIVAALVGVNPGVGIWVILVVVTGVVVVRMYRGRFSIRDWLSGLPPRLRAALETVALPMAVWWLSPEPIHPKTVYSFLRSSRGGAERAPFDVLYYLRSYLADYVPHPGWGIALLALAAGAVGMALVARRKGNGVGKPDHGSHLGFLALLTVLGLLLVTLHPHKEIRYAATALPLVTLLGALGLGRLLLGEVPKSPGGAPRTRLVAGGLAGLLAVGLAAAAGPLAMLGSPAEVRQDRLEGELSAYTGDPRLLPVLEPLAERVGPGGRAGMMGPLDELSADLVRWVLAREHGGAMAEVVDFRERFDPGASRERWWPRIERWIAEEDLDRLLVVRLDPDSPWAQRDDYLLHNAWQAAAVEALGETFPAGEELRVPEVGLTVQVLTVQVLEPEKSDPPGE